MPPPGKLWKIQPLRPKLEYRTTTQIYDNIIIINNNNTIVTYVYKCLSMGVLLKHKYIDKLNQFCGRES